MSRRQVDEVMAEVPKTGKCRIAGEEILRFTHAHVVIRDDRVVEIGLGSNARVFLRDKLLFDDPEAWRELVASDANAQKVLGLIVLRQLGLTLTGFHDGDISQLAVTAFEAGRWDAFAGAMKPFKLDVLGD